MGRREYRNADRWAIRPLFHKHTCRNGARTLSSTNRGQIIQAHPVVCDDPRVAVREFCHRTAIPEGAVNGPRDACIANRAPNRVKGTAIPIECTHFRYPPLCVRCRGFRLVRRMGSRVQRRRRYPVGDCASRPERRIGRQRERHRQPDRPEKRDHRRDRPGPRGPEFQRERPPGCAQPRQGRRQARGELSGAVCHRTVRSRRASHSRA